MDKTNLSISILVGIAVIGYVFLAALDKNVQQMQSIVSLLVGVLAGNNLNSAGKLISLGAKKAFGSKNK